MNAKLTKILLYLPTTALGLWCLSLQASLLQQGYDERGLLDLSNAKFWLLWGITVAFLVTVACLLPRLGGNGSYRKNFPKCILSGSVMIIAGVLTALWGMDQITPWTPPLLSLAAVAAGGAMAVCGVLRLTGRRPPMWFDLAVCLFYGYHLMMSYRRWNADPQIQKYAFQLLAEAALMLFSLHRARCAGGMIDRRRLVFAGFAGIFLCFVAMAGAESPLFYAASGLWCAGGMCELTRLRRRPAKKDAPEFQPEQTELPDRTNEE